MKTIFLSIILPLFLAAAITTQAAPYEPRDKEEFVFQELYPTLQKYGYPRFCTQPKRSTCLKRLPYLQYLGTKGYFLSQSPIVTREGYRYHEVILEDGEHYYFYGEKYSDDSPIIPAEKQHAIDKFEPEPLIPGLDISIDRQYSKWGKDYFALSTGQSIDRNTLESVRKITPKGATKEFVRTLLSMTFKHDDMDNVTFISPRSKADRSDIYLYIGHDQSRSWLRFKLRYYADDWLFVRSFKIAADDFRWQSPKLEFERDHAGGYIWEWVDISTSDELSIATKKLAMAQKAIVRFQGDQYYHDMALSEKQKMDLQTVLKVYGAINQH